MLTSFTEEFPEVTIIHMSGMMTHEYLKDSEDIWNEQLKKRPESLALDLKNVESIDSISINHLFNLSKRAAALNVRLIIYDASDELRKIFEIVRIERAVTMMSKEKFQEEYLIRS